MNKGFNIQTSTKIAAVTLCLMLFSRLTIVGQPEAFFSNNHFCEHAAVNVPMFVNNFNDISSMTLMVNYDHDVLEFVEVRNPHTLLASGNLLWEHLQQNEESTIVLTWIKGANSLTLPAGILFDLHFSYSEGFSQIWFSDDCEVSVDLVPHDGVIFTDGVVAHLEVFNQPADQFVSVNEQATFSISLNGDVHYQWQEKVADDWIDILESERYLGTTTDNLIIANVPESMDKHQYRCVIALDDCTIYSDVASLYVSSTNIGEYGTKQHAVEVFPNPFFDVFFYASSAIVSDYHVQVSNIRGEVVYRDYRTRPEVAENGTITLVDQKPGIYFLTIYGDNLISNTKVLKQ
jgi:hypothetical protein